MTKTILLLLLLLSALILLSGADCMVRAEIMAPAAPIYGMTDDAPTSAVFGPVQSCSHIRRRFMVLNPDIVQGEPLVLRLVLESETPGDKQEFRSQLLYGTGVRVFVTPPNKLPPYEYFGIRRGSVGPTASVDLLEQSHMRMDFRLAFDDQSLTGAAFDIPGKYELKVVHDCVDMGAKDEFPMDMGTFEVKVREATGDDKRALDLLDDFDIFRYFQMLDGGSERDGSSITERQLNKIQRLIKDAPKAALRPYAQIILGNYALKKNNLDEARSQFRQVRKEYPGSIPATLAANSLLRVELQAKDDDAARAAFNVLWTDPVATQLVFPGGGVYKQFVQSVLPEKPGTQWMVWVKPGPDPVEELTEQEKIIQAIKANKPETADYQPMNVEYAP